MNVQKESLRSLHIDKSWTLFLDRDGVINKKIDGDYVRNSNQFVWLPGVQEALKKLSSVFGRIIIASNQQGIGKGLMTNEQVEVIHDYIRDSISRSGGRIDGVYYAPQLESDHSQFRKPNIGMALQARKDFPNIDFSKSIMAGDSITDMEFGKKAGMTTVYILNGKIGSPDNDLVDFVCNSLLDFSDILG